MSVHSLSERQLGYERQQLGYERQQLGYERSFFKYLEIQGGERKWQTYRETRGVYVGVYTPAHKWK